MIGGGGVCGQEQPERLLASNKQGSCSAIGRKDLTPTVNQSGVKSWCQADSISMPPG